MVADVPEGGLMAIALSLGLAVLVVLLVVAFVLFVLIGMFNRNVKATQDLHQLVVKQERDRMHAKCSGLFARLFRALNKEEVYVTYNRVEFNIVSLHLGGTSINVAVREERGAFETGQLVAYADGYPTIHSCEEDIRIFARQIRQALAEIGVRRSA